MVGQLILGLSIIVGLHEWGHLITAKFFGMRVEKFSIGFPPKIFGVNWGETEYSVGALPLGGFVKISGMIDESFDTKQLAEEPKDYEFRAKPAWQRLIVMMGGILVNVITGIMMFVGLVYVWGDPYLPISEVNKYGLQVYELGEEIGLQTGDQIIAVNGVPAQKYYDVISPDAFLSSNSYYTVLRDGKELRVDIPNNMIERLSENKDQPPFTWRTPFSIGMVAPGRPAEEYGMQSGDVITSFNGDPITYFHEFKDLQDEHKGETIKLGIKRDGKEITLSIPSSADGTFGFQPEFPIENERVYYSFAESIPLAVERAFGSVWLNIKGFSKIFRQEVSVRSLSGPIGIAKIFGTEWDWYHFWRIVAILSMWLAFLNFLPIPALDGGHVMFLMFEIVSGKKPSDNFLEKAQYVGIFLLLALMVFVISIDIFNLFY